ncbi:hypothetical protein [Nitrososphaera sp.]
MIETIEAIGYVALGFAATFAGLEAAWRVALKDRHVSAVHPTAARVK